MKELVELEEKILKYKATTSLTTFLYRPRKTVLLIDIWPS